jgi:hypothetical protein
MSSCRLEGKHGRILSTCMDRVSRREHVDLALMVDGPLLGLLSLEAPPIRKQVPHQLLQFVRDFV